MKTAKLFGVRFIVEPGWKEFLLATFIAGKSQKINEENQRELARISKIEKLLNTRMDGLRENLDKKNSGLDFKEVGRFLQEEASCRHYYITAPVLEMSGKIRVKEPFDTGWLAPVPDGKRQLNFNNQFIRYEKTGSRIVVLSALLPNNHNSGENMKYSFFNMNLETKLMSESEILDDYEPSKVKSLAYQDFDAASRKLFMQLITFMELSKIQEIFLAPGRKNGVKKSTDHVLNDTSFPITIVNTNWNKIIRREGFHVDGHLRKQPHGPGNLQRKLIWVDDYHKQGYNLGAARIREEKKRGLGL